MYHEIPKSKLILCVAGGATGTPGEGPAPGAGTKTVPSRRWTLGKMEHNK